MYVERHSYKLEREVYIIYDEGEKGKMRKLVTWRLKVGLLRMRNWFCGEIQVFIFKENVD